MDNQGRNDPCHCGSGKKFKVCHGEVTSNFNQQWVIAGIIGGIFLLFFFMDSGSSTTTITNSAIPTSVIPQARTGSAAPPPGSVWSSAHGHWHDSETKPSSTVPGVESNLPQPKPPGETPPGKVWSPDHGHWHDIQ